MVDSIPVTGPNLFLLKGHSLLVCIMEVSQDAHMIETSLREKVASKTLPLFWGGCCTLNGALYHKIVCRSYFFTGYLMGTIFHRILMGPQSFFQPLWLNKTY